jgi:hypothetical protein
MQGSSPTHTAPNIPYRHPPTRWLISLPPNHLRRQRLRRVESGQLWSSPAAGSGRVGDEMTEPRPWVDPVVTDPADRSLPSEATLSSRRGGQLVERWRQGRKVRRTDGINGWRFARVNGIDVRACVRVFDGQTIGRRVRLRSALAPLILPLSGWLAGIDRPAAAADDRRMFVCVWRRRRQRVQQLDMGS